MANDKFTAKEARLISDSKNTELLEILSAVEDNAKNGRYDLKLYEDISTTTIEKLNERGFKVDVKHLDGEPSYYTITW